MTPDQTADADVVSERVHSAIRAANEFLAHSQVSTGSPGEAIMGLLIAARAICERYPSDPPLCAFEAFIHAVVEMPSRLFHGDEGPQSS